MNILINIGGHYTEMGVNSQHKIGTRQHKYSLKPAVNLTIGVENATI